MSLLAAPPAVPASIRPPAVHRYLAKAAVAPVRHLLSANPAEDPPDIDEVHLNQLQGSRFLQKDIRPSVLLKVLLVRDTFRFLADLWSEKLFTAFLTHSNSMRGSMSEISTSILGMRWRTGFLARITSWGWNLVKYT